MILSFHPCFDSDVQVILGDRDLNEEITGLIGRAEAIILPQTCSEKLYQLCRRSNAFVFPSYDARFRYKGKVGQSLLFEEFRLPHPKTLRWPSVEAFQRYTSSDPTPHPFPYLLKSDGGHEGEGVYPVENEAALEKALRALSVKGSAIQSGFITQSFVESGGNVLRAVIIGKPIITYWKRPDTPGRQVTTISRGARVDPAWCPELQEKGRDMARLFSERTGDNLAAIDFVYDFSSQEPSPLFLEVNYTFGRRGLGGSENFYRLLYSAIQDWLRSVGMDHRRVLLA